MTDLATRPTASVSNEPGSAAPARPPANRWTPLVYTFSALTGAGALLAVWAHWSGHGDLFGWMAVATFTVCVLALLALAEENRPWRRAPQSTWQPTDRV